MAAAIRILAAGKEDSGCREGKKEDCELNAFHRLARRLKKMFPRLQFCVVVAGVTHHIVTRDSDGVPAAPSFAKATKGRLEKTEV